MLHKILFLFLLPVFMFCASRPMATDIKVAIREYDVPTPNSRPHDPAIAPDGALWYTGQLANKLGRLDPKTGEIKEYSLKMPNSGPHGLAADKDGNIWFTANFKPYIGKLDPRTGDVTEYPMPDPRARDPHSLVFDREGMIFFTAQDSNFVGKLDPRNGKIMLKEVATPQALPYGIIIGPDNAAYFCEFGSNKTGKVDEWPSPAGPTSHPYGIASTSDGTVWYSESGVKPNTLVAFNPKTKSFQSWPIPSGGGVVRNMVATPDDKLYLACSGVNKVAIAEVKH